MSGGGYAMHRLLVLRFILRSGNLEPLLHHFDICVQTHVCIRLHLCCYGKLVFQKFVSDNFFFIFWKNVVLGNTFCKLSFWTNTFYKLFSVLFSSFWKIMQICLFWSLWSGGQGGGQRIEIDQSGQNRWSGWRR